MDYEQILYAVADRVATITLNRPDKLNAWTPVMEREVRAAMEKSASDEQVRVIILTGAGRGFCAGADMSHLGTLATGQMSKEEIEKTVVLKDRAPTRTDVRPDFQKAYSYFPAIGKPILAAINGATAGLGFVISLYADMRFASDQAKFSTAFARRGLIAEYGASWMLPRLVGLANAFDLLFSSRLIDAAEALRMGLVSRVFPEAKFMEGVRAYAVELANMVSPRSMRVIKRQVYDALFQTLGEAIDTAMAEMAPSFQSEDFKEGVAHYMAKRPPAFTGR